eukprot:m.535950 g.535950  ORF g.535950 m.535950 type:complete len:1052 (-) comp22067_c0_seq9:620-3775(-)
MADTPVSPMDCSATGSGGDSACSPAVGNLLDIPSITDKDILDHVINNAHTRSPTIHTCDRSMEAHAAPEPGADNNVPHLLDIPCDESVQAHVANNSRTRIVSQSTSSEIDLSFHTPAEIVTTEDGIDESLIDLSLDSDMSSPPPVHTPRSFSKGLESMSRVSSDNMHKEAEVEVSIVPTLGPSPSPCEGATLCWSNGGAFLFGGYVGSVQRHLNDLWRLDFENTEWQQLRWRSTCAPEARSSHVAAMIDPSHMIVFGGTGESSLDFNDTWVYDELSAVWTELEIEEKPLARRGAGAACVRGCLYLYGGTHRQHVLDDLWVLDKSLRTWRQVMLATSATEVERPLPLYNHTVVAWGEDTFVITGGSTPEGTSQGTVWIFSVGARQWEKASSALAPRSRHSACVLNDLLVVAGGCEDTSTVYTQPPVQVYDLRNGLWFHLYMEENDMDGTPSKRASATEPFFDFPRQTWVSPGSTAQRRDFGMIGVGPTTAWMWGGRDENGYCAPGAWSLDFKPVTSSAVSSTSAFALLDDDDDSENLMSPSLYGSRRSLADDRASESSEHHGGAGRTGTTASSFDATNSDGDVFSDEDDISIPQGYSPEHTQRLMHRRSLHHHDAVYQRIVSTGSGSEISDDGDGAAVASSPGSPDGKGDTSGYLTQDDLTERSSSEMVPCSPSSATPTTPVSPLHTGGLSLERMTMTSTPTQQSPSASGSDATMGPVHPSAAGGQVVASSPAPPGSNAGTTRPSAGSLSGRQAPASSGVDAANPNLAMWRRLVQEIGGTVGTSNWVAGDLLGRGAYGNVYKCFNRDNGTFFAAKRLSFGVLREAEMRSIVSEITTLQGVSHPHIVSYLGYDYSETELYIFMDYCPGGDLQVTIRTFGGLGVELASRYTRQICLGLEYLHDLGILHRDIKAANILLTIAGQAKLSDFGLSKILKNSDTLKSSFENRAAQSVVGSPYWMAPEVVTHSGAGRASDVWSLGCTVFEMATGKPPLAQFEAMAALFHVGSHRDMPEPPAQLGTAGCAFVRLCWQFDPIDRPTCTELLEHAFLQSASG